MNRTMLTWIAAIAAATTALAGCGNGTATQDRSPQIDSTPPTTAFVGVPFEYTVTASGMTPMVFTVVEGPEGMGIDPDSGVVAWTPRSEGSVRVEVMAANVAGSDSQEFDVEVEQPIAPVFTTTPPTEATVGSQYAYDPQVIATGEVVWSSPAAPAGWSIDPATGEARWTPNASQVGRNSVTVRATDENGEVAEQRFDVTVSEGGGAATITSVPPDRVVQGEVWSYDAAASGAPTLEWSLRTPSAGTPAVGVVIDTEPPEGTEVTVTWDTAGIAPGDYSVALQVENGMGSPDVQEFVVTVEARPPVPVIDLVTMPPPTTVFVGATYEYDANLTPETDSSGVIWSIVEGSTVPSDLAITIDRGTGEVAFTASQAAGEIRYEFAIRATNVLGEFDEETLVVDGVFPPAAPVLSVTPAVSFSLQVGEAFPGASASATGNPNPTLSISGTLPDFVEFDPLTGLLAASSTQPAPIESDLGNHSFDIVAVNTEGDDRVTIEITVVAAPPSVDSVTPAAGRRQSDVPIVVRGGGFVAAATPTIVLQLGAFVEPLVTTFVDEGTLTATVPTDLSRPSGVYDVVVDQGSTSALTKRFTVTEGDGSTLSGTIATDVTLTALGSPHHVTGDVRVESGVTVTIEPGAVLMFDGGTNRRMDVGVNSAGAVVADGGEPGVGDQIVFTRFQAVAGPAPSGHFRGLRFGSNVILASNVLRNVVVEFGGRRNGAADQGAIEVLSGSAPRIVDSIIRESLNFGVFVHGGAGTDAQAWLTDDQVVANARSPISVGGNDVSTLGPNLVLRDNGQDRIFVRTPTVSRSAASWRNFGVPYFLNQGIVVRGGSVMSLAPGTELRFASGRRLRVSTGTEPGTLVASATSESPIRMVADTGLVGDWNGLSFDDNVGAGTVLRHVRIEGFSASENGGIRVDDPDVPGAKPIIVEHCLIQSTDPGSVGIYLSRNAGVSSFENNVVDAEALSVDAALLGFDDVLGPGNVYEAPLRVRSSTATGAQLAWVEPVASDGSTQPIRPSGSLTVQAAGSLTITEGTQVQMPLDGQLQLIDSQLLVLGSVDDPVVFSPAPGVAFWRRILLRGKGPSGVSRIEHAVLDTAGDDPALGASDGRAALVVTSSGGVASTPSVANTTITNSRGYGAVFFDQSHCAGLCTGNTIMGSRFSALRMHANFVGRFGSGNALAGNNTSGTFGHEGVWVVGDTVDVDAFWPANDVPYVVQGNIELRQATGLDPVPTMTIEPGSELRFADNRRLRVGEGGDGILDARGTMARPIVFTTIDSGTPVYWRGIDLNQGSDGSILDRVTLSYGGRNDNTGNVNFRTGSVVTVGAVTFTDSNNYAGVIDPGSAPMFTGPPTDRVYVGNAFDCIRDVSAGTCEPL